ncbi:MAG: YybH family protein [Isosphaeraceae bacterium]
MTTKRMRRLVGVSAVALGCLGAAGRLLAQDAVVGRGGSGAPLATQTTAAASSKAAPAAAQSKALGLTGRPEEEKAVRAVGETFTSAYNAGDAKAVAALFTEDAEMVDANGAGIKGRPTIQAFFEAMFRERKGAKIEISLESLAFLGPEVAKEEGHTRVKPAEKEAADAVRRYTVLFVKQGGKWLYTSVHEDDEPALAHHERLKELEWMLGDWIDETTDSTVHASCRWSPDKNFLLRDFTIHVQGKPVMTVTQRIGWDPLTKQIRSWFFDSEGGYGEGYWTRDGKQWIIKSTGVLPDGRTASATNVLTRVGPHSARWASIQRTVGGQVVPNLQEYVMVRRPPPPRAHVEPR